MKVCAKCRDRKGKFDLCVSLGELHNNSKLLTFVTVRNLTCFRLRQLRLSVCY
jgi:hypothetical protein